MIDVFLEHFCSAFAFLLAFFLAISIVALLSFGGLVLADRLFELGMFVSEGGA